MSNIFSMNKSCRLILFMIMAIGAVMTTSISAQSRKVRNRPSSKSLLEERPVFTSEQIVSIPRPRLQGSWQLCYATLQPDPKYRLRISLVSENINNGVGISKQITFLSSLGKNNYFYIFDPIIISKGKYLMKFGRTEGATDSYKVVTYTEGEKESKIVINQDLRNRFLQVSPNGHYLAYVVGGSYDGPDKSYFKNPLELWVCDLTNGQKSKLASGDALNQAYRWRDDHTLVYFNTVVTRTSSTVGQEPKSSTTASINSYDTLTQSNTSLWTTMDVPWQNDDLLKALQVALYSQSRPSISPDAMLKQKEQINGGSFQYESFSASDTLTFYQESGKSELIKGSNNNFLVSFDKWIINPELKLINDERNVRIVTYKYQPSLRYVGLMDEGDVVAVKTFDSTRSPVTQSPAVSFPRKVFSLLRVDKQNNQVVWEQKGVMGMTVMQMGGLTETLHY